MIKSFILPWLLLASIGSRHAPDQVAIPKGKPVMVDGRFSAGEWTDAKTLKVQEDIMLYLKQSADYVYIGVQAPVQNYRSGWMELYLADGPESIVNLHASRKLGERKLMNGEWGPWKEWWTNQGKWHANYYRPDDVQEDGRWKVVQLQDEGWEYQIRRSAFGNGPWKIMLDVSLMAEEVQTIKYPSNAEDTNPENWLLLKI
ncbi:hypothetical protein I0P70_16765 [Pontibacter sp. FD36]|uniref:hypothetical protein n=1 Tax=Pontibacter sp. FD36 TaxID=2789860 RepID=UPI0018A9A224|nr:hypothetical protein [Pontibacter sp. FD36]MBF8964903.1 hypothetical protein [Pontibacter sp. FD36]